MTFKNVSTYNELSLQILYSKMHINVAQLLKEPVGSSRSHQIDESIGEEGINSIKGEVTLARTNHGILVRGTMTGNVTAVCSRCLSPVDCLVSFELEDEFFPRADIPSGSAYFGEYDNSTTIDDNNVLDLSEVLRQYTLSAMPIKPLCHPDCAGLCPSCGHNFNQYPCRCSSRVYDERLSKLVRLGKESEV